MHPQSPSAAPNVSRADRIGPRLRRAAIGAGGLALGAGAFLAASSPTIMQAASHVLAAVMLIGNAGGGGPSTP